MNNKISLVKEVAWASQNMPRTLRQVAALPDLSGVRLACCMHLDMKMIPLVQGILDKGAQVFLTTCNPTTVQDDVVAWLVERGAEACAWRNMSDADWQQSWEKAIAWQPTHLCEMGADITTLLHQRGEFGNIVAGLEATGSGVNRLGDIQPGYPIFNWDDLPVKEGLHNRHMVGLTAWHTFFQTTHLTLHEKKVLVIGYGLVGQERRGGGKSLWRSGDGGGDRSCPSSAGGLRRLARGGSAGRLSPRRTWWPRRQAGKTWLIARRWSARKRESLSLTSATWRKRSTASTCASTLRKR
ncbi:adenosylhomocysteinase [Klebsiella variicola subsp. variicola]|nr:adenosylhomocysteinase [Klebsiella variicola subsp. variicola]